MIMIMGYTRQWFDCNQVNIIHLGIAHRALSSNGGDNNNNKVHKTNACELGTMFRLKWLSASKIIWVYNERHCMPWYGVCARHVTFNTLEIIVDP